MSQGYASDSNTVQRVKLTAALSIYVRTDGSDNNDGLTNDAAGAFLTIQAAINHVCGNYDLGNFNLTIRVADGTYAENVALRSYVCGNGRVTLTGNSSDVTAVVIAPASGLFPITNNVTIGVPWTVSDLTLQPTATLCLVLQFNTHTILNGVRFVGIAGQDFMQISRGASLRFNADFSIDGDGVRFINAFDNAHVEFNAGITITLQNTPAFSSQFCAASSCTSIRVGSGVSFTGSATGSRYSIISNATVVGTGSGTFFPGATIGSTASGGFYS